MGWKPDQGNQTNDGLEHQRLMGVSVLGDNLPVKN